MTNNTRTREAHDAYRANRKEAGRVIDIETCEYMWFTPTFSTPTAPSLMMRRVSTMGGCFGRCWFVWSDESDGWIYEDDLPEEKWQALKRRMEHEQKLLVRKQKLWEAACAAHPMYEVDTEDGSRMDCMERRRRRTVAGRPDRMVQGQPSGAGQRGREQNQATRARD